MGDIVLPIYDGDYIDEDLEKIRNDGNHNISRCAPLLEAFLNQLAESEEARWKLLLRAGDYHNPYFNCKAIECFQRNGYNLYRIRPLVGSLQGFRVIYAFDAANDEIHLLAIVRKRPEKIKPGTDDEKYYNYEVNHPISNRIRDEYERHRFRKL